LISVEKALRTILSQIKVLGTERLDILSSLGRVLAEDIHAPFNVPPFDNSAMDGYAVKFADIDAASADAPARLKVIGDLPAGCRASQPLKNGEALRIMTGAPVPEGADTVIMQEDTQTHGTAVEILKKSPMGSNIRRAGEDIKKGEIIFQTGTKLRPAQIGVLASIKRAFITVYQRPRVAILSTGDELVDIDEEITEGKIVSSNSYSLSALVTESGGIPIALGIARDTKEELTERLFQSLNADIILSSGGVSVGDYDFVKDVLADLGIDMKFWKVSMRPGQPLAFGTIAGKPTFGLPGNPVSVMVSFEQFVRPAMRKMSGHKHLLRTTVEAVAEEKVKTHKGKRHFIRCKVKCKNGQYYASTTGEQGSGILMSMAAANGLMIVPEDQDLVNPGDRVRVQILDQEFGFTEEPSY